MKKDFFNPNIISNDLKKLTNAAGLPLVNSQAPQDIKVQILPDKNVPHGKFKASKAVADTWYAHPDTIRALRPDIFVLGDGGLEDFSKVCTCKNCHQSYDLQFFRLCPFCLLENQPNL